MEPSGKGPTQEIRSRGPRPVRSRRRTLAFRLLLCFAIAPVLAFLMLEGIVRMIGNADFHGTDYVVEDPVLQWANNADQRSDIVGFDYRFSVSLNSLGMRGPPPRADATARVLLLGDSYTFGLGVNDGDTTAAVLQERLDAASPRKFDVVNGGVSGYGVQQAFQLAKRHWERLHPSIVIWVHCGNDFADDWNFVNGTWGTTRARIPGRRFMLEHSEAWSMLKPAALALLGALSIRQDRIRLEGSGETTLVSGLGKRWAAGRDLTFQGIEALAAFARGHGASLFVTSVGFNPKAADERLSTDALAVRDHCRASGIPFVGPPPPAANIDTEPLVNRSSIGHWTPAGHRYFASALFDEIHAAGAW